MAIDQAAAQMRKYMLLQHVKTQADAKLHHATDIRKKKANGMDVTLRRLATPVTARVDWGRWIADCPACTSGVAVQHDWTEAYCYGCGAVLTAVTWPDDKDEAEAVLTLRQQKAQFYFPERETVEHLRAQNALHGVPEKEE